MRAGSAVPVLLSASRSGVSPAALVSVCLGPVTGIAGRALGGRLVANSVSDAKPSKRNTGTVSRHMLRTIISTDAPFTNSSPPASPSAAGRRS